MNKCKIRSISSGIMPKALHRTRQNPRANNAAIMTRLQHDSRYQRIPEFPPHDGVQETLAILKVILEMYDAAACVPHHQLVHICLEPGCRRSIAIGERGRWVWVGGERYFVGAGQETDDGCSCHAGSSDLDGSSDAE